MSTKQVAVKETFVVEMPDSAPALGFDPNGEAFTWQDVLPSNYWNLDLLEEKVAALGGNPVVTPARVVIRPVVDPEVDEARQDLSPKIVLEFVENVPALVFNKTRCTLATKLTATPNPRLWAERLPPLELYAGAFREMASAMQILFRPVAADDSRRRESRVQNRPAADATVADINDELFG